MFVKLSYWLLSLDKDTKHTYFGATQTNLALDHIIFLFINIENHLTEKFHGETRDNSQHPDVGCYIEQLSESLTLSFLRHQFCIIQTYDLITSYYVTI